MVGGWAFTVFNKLVFVVQGHGNGIGRHYCKLFYPMMTIDIKIMNRTCMCQAKTNSLYTACRLLNSCTPLLGRSH